MKFRMLLVITLTLSIAGNGLLLYYFLSREKGFMSQRYRQEMTWHMKRVTGQKGWLVFLGDSLTDQNDWSASYPNQEIVNLGKGGDTVRGVLARVDDLIPWQPAKIFLLIGINDIRYGTEPKDMLEDYEQLLKKLRAVLPNSELYLQSILPVTENFKHKQPSENQIIININQSIKQLADQYDIQYLDLHDFFTSHGQLKPDYTVDGLHLNRQGYALWERIILGFVYAEASDKKITSGNEI